MGRWKDSRWLCKEELNFLYILTRPALITRQALASVPKILIINRIIFTFRSNILSPGTRLQRASAEVFYVAAIHSMPTPKKPRRACLHCGASCARPSHTYCSNRCQLPYQQEQKISAGGASPRAWRSYLLRTDGHRCTICQFDTWNELPIPLELDHIDGNSGYTVRENLRLLCPNCPAQTDTYKNRNAGNGRHYRRLRCQKQWFSHLSLLPGSNQRPIDYKSIALPAELRRRNFSKYSGPI